jgi:HSP20 family molecular chaperone IbpA
MVRSLTTTRPRRNDLFFPVEQVFDDFFNNFFNSTTLDRVRGSGGFPKMDVYESDGQLVVSVAASGMKAEDIQIEVTTENRLVIRGRANEEYRLPDVSRFVSGPVVYLHELRSSTFERELQLPENVKGDPKAVMKDGILKLTWDVEKKQEAPQVKKIPIFTE